MARAENIDVSRAQCRAHAFHFFLGGAKACLLPFLSVYYRYLGLSPLETGAAIALQAWVLMLFSPFWTRCAFGCGKKKFVLVFSLFFLIGSYLLMTIIPSVDKEAQCSPLATDNITDVIGDVTHLEQSTVKDKVDQIANALKPEAEEHPGVGSGDAGGILTPDDLAEMRRFGVHTEGKTEHQLFYEIRTMIKDLGLNVEDLTDMELVEILRSYFSESKTTNNNKGKTTTTTTTRTTTTPQASTTTTKVTTTSASKGHHNRWKSTESPGGDLGGAAFFRGQSKEIREYMRTQHGLTADDFRRKSEEETRKELLAKIKEDERNAGKGRHRRDAGQGGNSSDLGGNLGNNTDATVKPDMLENTVNALRNFAQQLMHLKQQVFLAVMLVVGVGALFGAPVDRLADSLWFEYLDGLDRLELYGGHRLSATLGAVLFPAGVGAAVAYTPCLLPLRTHHILLHFYSFTALAAPAFILTFSFPVQLGVRKVQRSARLCKGLRMLCGGAHQALFTLSAMFVGATQGLMMTFMFWMLQDKAGVHAHAYMGGAVAISALSEIIVRLFMKGLIRRLTNAGTVVLGLFVLGIRLVVYSFLWRPWVALIAEGFHALSTTLVLASVETCQEFKLNPLAMDRSASAGLGFLVQGLGVGAGALAAGALYTPLGAPILFQGTAVLACVWCVTFAVLHKCCRKPGGVRYSKLLQEDNDTDDESDVTYEDDWLEVAMKHKE